MRQRAAVEDFEAALAGMPHGDGTGYYLRVIRQDGRRSAGPWSDRDHAELALDAVVNYLRGGEDAWVEHVTGELMQGHVPGH